MPRRRYIIWKLLPIVSVCVFGLWLLLELQRNDVELLDSEFVPQNPLAKTFSLEISGKKQLKEQRYFGNVIEKPETVKQMKVIHMEKAEIKTGVNNPVITDITVQSASLSNKTCQSDKCNFVFIKTMKCATETVVRILRKYSYENNLNIMLPRNKKIYFAWPYLMDDSDYRLSDRPFNGLIDHAIYNKTIMNHYFPPKTTHYVTIIREPLKHFKSTFNYFKVEPIVGIFAKQPLTEYLDYVDHYDSIYKSHEAATFRYCIPDGFSVTKNLMAQCLGMPLGFPYGRADISNNLHAVQDYIQNLDEEFSLVMIVEYFHESLILFKRLMKWHLKDMIYKHVNRGTYFFLLSNHHKRKHKQWAAIDYMIYDHFNKTLWEKITAEGPAFYDEVQHFSNIQQQVNNYCWGLDKTLKTNLHVRQTKFNSEFSISRAKCHLMDISWLEKIKEKFDKDNHHVRDTRPELRKKTC